MNAFFSDEIGPLPATALIALALACAITDVWRGKVYNAITYPAILVGLALQIALHGVAGLWLGLAGFAAGFFPAFLLFALGGMAGGDVKLLGAIGVLAGPVPTTEILIVAFLFGGLYALVQLAWEGRLLRKLWEGARWLAGMLVPGVGRVPLVVDRKSTVRFGLATSAAVLVVLWNLRTQSSGGVNALLGVG